MKRSEIKRRPLADTVLTSLEPEEKLYREPYGSDQLYLVVQPNNRKRWEMRLKKPSGVWSWLGLGTYPDVSIKAAREKARQAAALIEKGIDPAQQKASDKHAAQLVISNTFRTVAETWYLKKQIDGRAEATLSKIRTYLDKDILPALGDLPVAEITRRHCAALQAKIEARKAHNVAKKTRGWLREIFSQAVARGLTENNPASELLAIAAVAPPTEQHPHLLEPEIPDFINAMRTTTSRLPARTAAWLTIWTASRPGMVRWAEWTEVDLKDATWTVPAKKMKMSRNQVIPLCTQAIAALQDLHRVTGRSRYLFPGTGPKKPIISENTINLVFAKIGYKGKLVGHGTRHTASTLLREHGWTKDHVEAQLAHKEDGMSGIYNKARYLPQRKRMMQWYADYLEKLGDGMSPQLLDQFAKSVNGLR